MFRLELSHKNNLNLDSFLLRKSKAEEMRKEKEIQKYQPSLAEDTKFILVRCDSLQEGIYLVVCQRHRSK